MDSVHTILHFLDAHCEVRRTEFFREVRRARGLVKRERWLLLTRWVNLSWAKRHQLSHLLALNRKLPMAWAARI